MTSNQGRVINVSSRDLLMHPLQTINLKDPMFTKRPYSVSKAYYQSKLAQIMFTLWLSSRLRGTMVTANCICVSNVKENLDRLPRPFALDETFLSTQNTRFYFTGKDGRNVYKCRA